MAPVLCLLLLVTVVSGLDPFTSCYNPNIDCLPELRSVLNYDDYYWFGTKFAQDCKQRQDQDSFGLVDEKCINPSDSTSILSRMLPGYSSNDLKDVASTIQHANVTYSGESAAHYSCGHEFPARPKSPEGLKVEPLRETKWSLAQTDVTPSITWKSAPDTKYTVIVWDIGYFFLHGLYINADTSLDTAVPVYPYSGPKNPAPRANPYLFVVIPQPRGDLDYSVVAGVVYSILEQNNRALNFTTFLSTFRFSKEELTQSFMTVLNIHGDEYGAEYIKRNLGNLDNCAYFVSKSPYLYRASQRSMVSMAWSDAVMVTSPDTRDLPYLTSLELNMKVTYKSDPIKFESCCAKESFTQSQMSPDPFKGPYQMSELPVHVRDVPRIELTPMSGSPFAFAFKKYSLILVDFGIEQANFSSNAPVSEPTVFINWLATDISSLDVSTGNQIIYYQGPNPFTPIAPRLYTFLLLEQSSAFDPKTLKDYVTGDCPTFPYGCRYRLGPMLRDWGLYDIRAVNYFWSAQDSFARQKIYREFRFDKKAVCRGVKGFTDPCPWDCQALANTARYLFWSAVKLFS